MPEVLRIENEGYGAMAWKEEQFLQCLRQRNCIGMVAELGEEVAGFMIYELHKDSVVVVNLAVKSSLRRRSIGRQMMNKLKSKLSSHRRTRLEFTVRESNLGAQCFLRNSGLKARLPILKGHFQDTGEDGYRMLHEIAAGEDS